MHTQIYTRDPTTNLSYSNNQVVYKGQTSVIRFEFVSFETNPFDVQFKLSTSLNNDHVETKRLFLVSAGDNFPCLHKQSEVNSFDCG
jgi:hypothetical protein